MSSDEKAISITNIHKCPHCGSKNIGVFSSEVTSTGRIDIEQCDDCNNEWKMILQYVQMIVETKYKVV